MKIKTEWLNYNLDEKEVLEQNLNQHAAQGWQLKSLGLYRQVYVQSEEQLTYRVDYNEEMRIGTRYDFEFKTQKKIELYEEMGMKFVSCSRFFMVYASNQPQEMLYSDSQDEKTVHYALKSRYHLFHKLFLVFCLFELIAQFASVKGWLMVISSNLTSMVSVMYTILLVLYFIVADRRVKGSLDHQLRFIRHRTMALCTLAVMLLVFIGIEVMIVTSNIQSGLIMVILLAAVPLMIILYQKLAYLQTEGMRIVIMLIVGCLFFGLACLLPVSSPNVSTIIEWKGNRYSCELEPTVNSIFISEQGGTCIVEPDKILNNLHFKVVEDKLGLLESLILDDMNAFDYSKTHWEQTIIYTDAPLDFEGKSDVTNRRIRKVILVNNHEFVLLSGYLNFNEEQILSIIDEFVERGLFLSR